MDSNLQSPAPDSTDTKAAFRKPSNDVVNRKYRRHSPVSGSSSSDGSPKYERSSSPIFTREDPAKVSEHRQRRKDDGRELGRDSGRSQYGRSSDSYRHSGRHSSRSSHGYPRHDDYRHEKHADEEERNYQRTSSRGRESRDGTHSDHTRQESEHSRSRDYSRNVDKYSRDRYDGSGNRNKDKGREISSLERRKYKDLPSERAGSGKRHTNSNFEEERDRHTRDRDGRDEKRDYRRSSGDNRNDRTVSYEESRGHRNDSTSGWDNSGHRLKEAYKGDQKEQDGQKLAKEEKKKYDDWEANRDKDRYNREPGEWFEDKSVLGSENQESPAKKPKLFSLEKSSDCEKDDSKFSSTVADERQSSSSKQSLEAIGQAQANNSDAANDLNAAKVAAMKAAELVNKNLVGGGYMTTDQKKKLLWGNKKSTTADESGNQWDTALFSDRDRQEKFNKLMSLRLPWYLWPIVGCEGRSEGGSQTRKPRWQRPPPSREAEGTSAGFREAVHCRTATKRWTYCWIRSLSICARFFCTLTMLFCDILLSSGTKITFLTTFGILGKSALLLDDLLSSSVFYSDSIWHVGNILDVLPIRIDAAPSFYKQNDWSVRQFRPRSVLRDDKHINV